MKRNMLLLWMAVFVGSSYVYAEDIDLFVGRPVSAAEAPNLLLILDNGANFSSSAPFTGCPGVANWPTALIGTTGGIEQCALYKVVEALEPGSVNLGIMVFNGVDIPECTGNNGGCLARPIVSMTDANKTALLDWIRGWKTSGKTELDSVNIKSNSNKNGSVMQEAWAVFAGRTGLSGQDYSSRQAPTTCGTNFVVFVGNAYNNNGTPGEGGSASPKDALEGSLTGSAQLVNASPAANTVQRTLIQGPIPVSCETSGSFTFSTSNHEQNGFYADEWSRYMKSQGIVTYSVGLLGPGCKQSYEALLSSMATEGGGKFFRTTNYQELLDAFGTTISEIQAKNSAFASVSLPVSVSAQGSYLNQVFIGMFRPEKAPRWQGNLKQYKLGFAGSSLKLLDADDQSAVSSADTGFIAECARSFWTPPKSTSGDNLYWAGLQDANCINYSAKSETPDGNIVEKGAQGYKLRAVSPAARVVKTCGSTCVETLSDFNSSNAAITAAALGVSEANRSDLINWARGLNVDGEVIGHSSTGEAIPANEATSMMRPSAHGDVVHSRPVAIDFATSGSPEVVVFYGANDGMLRAINGNRDGGKTIGGKDPGEELWAFVAPESYGLFARLRANTDFVKFPNVTDGSPKSYGFDGAVTAHRTASETLIYAGMRRGGRMMYAFDVSIPESPKLKWRIGCPLLAADTGCVDGFSGIGQTWATPTVLTSAGYVTTGDQPQPKPMLIIGGGYNSACEDLDTTTNCDRANGSSIYVLDADEGTLLKSFLTEGGVVGDITVVKNSQGLAMYAYAADLSGNLYRISGGVNSPIGAVTPDNWTITTIARLGGSGVDRRKFMFGPDVVVDSGVHYVLLGSGDREKPILDYANASAVNNYFFMVKDQPTDTSWLSSERATCGADVLCLGSLYPISSSDMPDQATIDAKKGWYLALDTREKVVTSALTIFGTVYFSTHRPMDVISDQACSPDLGETRAYAIRFDNAAPISGTRRYEDLVGDGLPPSPVAGLVTLDNGAVVPFCIGCNPSSPLESKEPPMPQIATQPKARVFWNIER